MDLDLVGADIRDVLRLFAEVSGLNFIVGEEIRGEVTLRFKRVRWRSALDAVLRARGLEMVRQGNIVRIETAEKMARERKEALDRRRHCIETSPLRVRLIRLSYARAAEMAPLVRSGLSERGTVEIDARTNALIVRDVDCP